MRLGHMKPISEAVATVRTQFKTSERHPPSFVPPSGGVSIADETCEICRGARYVKVEVPGHVVPQRRECQCTITERHHAICRQLQLDSHLTPKMLHRMRFDSFRTEHHPSLTQVLFEVQEYVAVPDGWLFIQGGFGTGKTHLAVAAAAELIRRGYAVYYGLTSRLLEDLKRSYSATGDHHFDRRWNRLNSTDVLILDDLGVEEMKDWNQGRLMDLLDARYVDELPTIIASNLSPEDYGGRIGSRMGDEYLVTHATIAAGDFRKLATTRE
jgi:DNA replication protein DnaC